MICTDTDECAERVIEILREGGIAVFPTDTVYGIGAYLENRKAVGRIYKIKKRPLSKPIAVLVSNMKMAEEIGKVNNTARRLAKAFWPGALTIVVEGREGKKVAVRMPAHRFALKISVKPLATSSANLSGAPAPAKFEDALIEGADIYVDGGSLPGKPSTIYDATTNKIIREGIISSKVLREYI